MRRTNRADDFDWTEPDSYKEAVSHLATHRGCVGFRDHPNGIECYVQLSIVPCHNCQHRIGSIEACGFPESTDEFSRMSPLPLDSLFVRTLGIAMLRLHDIYEKAERSLHKCQASK